MNNSNPVTIYPSFVIDNVKYEYVITIGVMLKIMAIYDVEDISIILDRILAQNRKNSELITLTTEICKSQNENFDIDKISLDDLREIRMIFPEILLKSFPDAEEKDNESVNDDNSSYFGWVLFALKEINQTEQWLFSKTPRYINDLIDYYGKVYSMKDKENTDKNQHIDGSEVGNLFGSR